MGLKSRARKTGWSHKMPFTWEKALSHASLHAHFFPFCRRSVKGANKMEYEWRHESAKRGDSSARGTA